MPSVPTLLPDDNYFLNIDERRQNLICELEQVIEKSEKKLKSMKMNTSISSYFSSAEEIANRSYLEKIENEKIELKEVER